MKVSIQCNSPLLQHALEYSLRSYIDQEHDILISDEYSANEKLFLVNAHSSAHLQVPFSVDKLHKRLQYFLAAKQSSTSKSPQEPKSLSSASNETTTPSSINIETKRQIAKLMQEYTKKIIHLIESNAK